MAPENARTVCMVSTTTIRRTCGVEDVTETLEGALKALDRQSKQVE